MPKKQALFKVKKTPFFLRSGFFFTLSGLFHCLYHVTVPIIMRKSKWFILPAAWLAVFLSVGCVGRLKPGVAAQAEMTADGVAADG